VDAVSIAKGYGCDAARVTSPDALARAAAAAWSKDVPTVLEVPIVPEIPPLV
jgi:benzoylformate decarboxylase